MSAFVEQKEKIKAHMKELLYNAAKALFERNKEKDALVAECAQGHEYVTYLQKAYMALLSPQEQTQFNAEMQRNLDEMGKAG